MNYETTRVHPRSLSQAFADERAGWFEGPQRSSIGAVNASIAIAVVVVLVLITLISSGVWK